MSRERWGTYSVRDHIGPQPFAADVLMFDRLIIPHPEGEKEYVRWAAAGWQPDRLDQMLGVLRADADEKSRRAITVPWNDFTEDLFSKRTATAGVLDAEANLQWTRRLLATDLKPLPIPGSGPVEVLAAYRSLGDLQEDWLENDRAHQREVVTAAIAYTFCVPQPAGKSDVEVLRQAVGLADDSEFQRKRARIYKWRDEVIQRGITRAEAVEEMADYINEYNEATKKAFKEVYTKFAFTLIPVSLAAFAGPLAPAAAAGAIANLVRFWMFDRKPNVKAGESEVAAMLHTVQQELGWRPLAA